MEGEAEPDRRPIALEEGLEFSRGERRRARLARFVHREVGRKQHIAHAFGPGLLVELDQAVEFAQDMSVAEGVRDRVEPAVRQEVVVHDDASVQIFRDRAPFFVGAIEGEGQLEVVCSHCSLPAMRNPVFVEMANPRLGHPDADERVDLPQRLRLLSHPGDDAGRTDERRAEEIAERLGSPILGQKLLDIEIDRRRPEALAIWVSETTPSGNAAFVSPRQQAQR